MNTEDSNTANIINLFSIEDLLENLDSFIEMTVKNFMNSSDELSDLAYQQVIDTSQGG